MAKTFGDRLRSAWNAFRSRDPTTNMQDTGVGYTYRPDRPRLSRGNERSIITALYNRIAVDVSDIDIRHCIVDDEDRYVKTVHSGLNDCLSVEANKDQTYKAFIQDVVLSMFDEGVVAIVPVDTDYSPEKERPFEILTMRTAKVIEWRPNTVKLRLYNDQTGNKEEIWMKKSAVCIIENPFYAIMNEPNSTMQRLIRKLNLLDYIDEQSGSGKLDLIIQLPYVIKSQTRREQAETRRKDIEMQLAGSKYGIAYVDGTERITQLNRPVENNLMKQIEYLTAMLYSQMGFDQTILAGTADEKTMLNYNKNIIKAVIKAIVDEMKRKFLTRENRNAMETIMFFSDPFELVPIDKIADIADKFTRNEILSKNEVRQIVGRKPSEDPKADKLINSNISQPTEALKETPPKEEVKKNLEGENQNEEV